MKRCLFLIPNLRTHRTIGKTTKNRPKRSVLIFGSPNQIVIPTMPGGMAGPFRLVRFKHAMRVFTNFAHELYQFKSGGADSKIKKPQKSAVFILAAQIKNNANTIIQEIINIAEMLTDADIAIYRMPDDDFVQLPRILENNIQSKI